MFRRFRDAIGDAATSRGITVLLWRLVRKTFHLTRRLAEHVENKATSVIQGETKRRRGEDHGDTVPMEELYYDALPYIVPLHPALPLRGRQPCVTLLIPSMRTASFFGGTATALIISAMLAEELGYDLRVVSTLENGKPPLDFFFEREGVEFNQKMVQLDVSMRTYLQYGYIDIHPDDIFVASAWWDAYLIERLELERRFLYIIQDFEPIFYNNSDTWALAESTYRSENYVPLCNTKLLYDFMLNRGYGQVGKGTWFEPAVAKPIVRAPKSPSDKRRLFLYGRPSVERNLFYTGLASLDRCFSDGLLSPRDWEVFMAGEDSVPDVTLRCGLSIRNLGKMDYEAYSKFIQTVDVAVSLMMAPHPNYPTLEFASAGAAVVSTCWDQKRDLSRYSKNIIMSEIGPDSIAAAIAEAARLDPDVRLVNARLSRIPSSWSEALAQPLSEVSAMLRPLPGLAEPPGSEIGLPRHLAAVTDSIVVPGEVEAQRLGSGGRSA